MDNKRTGEGGYTLLYYIGGAPPALPRREGGREGEGRGERKTEPTQEARAEAKFIVIMPSNKEEKTAKRD